MKLKRKYIDLEDTLKALKIQVIDSLDFAVEYLPNTNLTPKQIFNFLKKDFVYVSDPDGIELLQSFPTMYSYFNYHGIYGGGDCDCATIAAAACLTVCGYPVDIALVGRSDANAVHIYCITGTYSPVVPFDLTNDKYGQERKYPFKQVLPLLIK